MWIFTPKGFYSIVRVPGESDFWQVRARRKKDIAVIAEKFLGKQIIETPERDYPFRVYVTREQLQRLVLGFASGISYSNFKNEIPERDHDYVRAAALTWQTLYDQLDERAVW